MPRSQFVSSDRLWPLLAYLVIAVIAVIVVGVLVPSAEFHRILVIAWLVLFPVGGWMVWRRG